MPILILLRHGQSQWNLENRFTGWVDVDLTPEGEAQAELAGERIGAEGLLIDTAYTSVLTRAVRTCNIALDCAGQSYVPVEKDWRLNERHYGALTGLNKAETAAVHGEEQVRIWRRAYDTPPPPLAEGSPWDTSADRRYRHASTPRTESLKTTLDRVSPYWDQAIAPSLRRSDVVLIAAHGNSLRAIVKHLFELPDTQIVDVEIPTGNPLELVLDDHLRPVSGRYLDPARASAVPTPPA